MAMNEYRKFNGWFAVVDDCDNVLYESKEYEKAFEYFENNCADDDLWLTREMDLYCNGLIELGFTSFKSVTIEY